MVSGARRVVCVIFIRYVSKNFNSLIECFHLTSRRPCWCSQTKERRPCWCPQQVIWVLNSILMLTFSFPLVEKRCSWITWVKTLYWCCISLSEVNYDTCLALARFHLLVNAHFPSPFLQKNEFNEITLIFKMTKDAISFLGHRNTTQIKTRCHWTG